MRRVENHVGQLQQAAIVSPESTAAAEMAIPARAVGGESAARIRSLSNRATDVPAVRRQDHQPLRIGFQDAAKSGSKSGAISTGFESRRTNGGPRAGRNRPESRPRWAANGPRNEKASATSTAVPYTAIRNPAVRSVRWRGNNRPRHAGGDRRGPAGALHGHKPGEGQKIVHRVAAHLPIVDQVAGGLADLADRSGERIAQGDERSDPGLQARPQRPAGQGSRSQIAPLLSVQ